MLGLLVLSCSVPTDLLVDRECPCAAGWTCAVGGYCEENAELLNCGCDTEAACLPLRKVSFGGAFAFYLRSDGALFSAGQHDGGRLGLGPIEVDQLVPQRLEGEWIDVAAGGNHACGIDVLGALYCWGGNNDGAAGLGESSGSDIPTLVDVGPFDALRTNSGRHITFARRSSGVWVAMGFNEWGLANVGSDADEVRRPMNVIVPPGEEWRDIQAGIDHACGLTESGRVYCWGNDTDSAFGFDNPDQETSPSTQVLPGEGWKQVYVGYHHTCALHEDGVLYCAGSNSSRIAARGDRSVVLPEFAPTDPLLFEIESFHAEFDHLCAFSTEGEAYCWGDNADGDLGFGHTERVDMPTRAPHFDRRNVLFGRNGAYSFMEGENRVWGLNDIDPNPDLYFYGRGRLGLGHVDNVTTPTQLCVE